MARFFTLFFALIVIPVTGISQSLPKNGISTNGAKQMADETAHIPGDENSLAISGNEIILGSIQDTINEISSNTKPKEFIFWKDSSKVGSWIGLLALIAGIAAAYYARVGYKYQKKSAESLENMEKKRLPFMAFAKKIFENILTLDILAEIEDYCPDAEKSRKRDGYQAERHIAGLKMPDDLIDMRCYEKFSGDGIYAAAIKMKIDWRNYNRIVDELAIQYEKGEYEKAKSLYRKLRQRSVSLLNGFFAFEDLITANPIKKYSVLKSCLNWIRFYFPREKEVPPQDGSVKLPPHIFHYYRGWKTQGGLSSHPIDSKKRFLSHLFMESIQEKQHKELRYKRMEMAKFKSLQDFMALTGSDIPWLADCTIFKHDADSLDFNTDFVEEDYARKMIDRKLLWGQSRFWNVIKLSCENPHYIQSHFHGWPYSALEMFILAYEGVFCGPMLPENQSWNRIFRYAWRRYIDGMVYGPLYDRKQDNSLLVAMVYNLELGLRRRVMIEDAQFLESEKALYAEELYRYNSFADCFEESTKLGISFRQLIYAIVAEQNVSFNALWLNIGIGRNESKVLYVKASDFIPVLETIGVINGGKIAIRTRDEVDNIMAVYGMEDFSYRVDEKDAAKVLREHFERRNIELEIKK